ncbi:MAG: glycosyltransferase [Burkholderiales bacterium]
MAVNMSDTLGSKRALKVMLFAPASVVHTQRWVEGLASRGVDLLLLTQHPSIDWRVPSGVGVKILPFDGTRGYFLNAWRARQALRQFKPDIVNSHYASGYGTLGTLAAFRPHLMSVWGSDVFDFPYQSAAAGHLVRWNLRRADRIASTSRVMAEQVRRLVPTIGPIDITPFGVESNRFVGVERPVDDHRKITIGTVKTLADKYGVDVLIDAFALLLRDPDPQLAPCREHLKLLLVGDGPDRAKLEAQADALGIRALITFVGKVAHADVPAWLNKLDVYVAASRLDSESFGVAVIEASSCGLPVVVSDAGGLPEVVRDGVTGLIVPRNDCAALSAALKSLVTDAALRKTMGQAGRVLVIREYEWEHCVDKMLESYAAVIRAHRQGRPGKSSE